MVVVSDGGKDAGPHHLFSFFRKALAATRRVTPHYEICPGHISLRRATFDVRLRGTPHSPFRRDPCASAAARAWRRSWTAWLIVFSGTVLGWIVKLPETF